MKLVDGLRKLGFRRWYERELLQSHGHLALCFVCLVGVFAAFEATRERHSLADQAVDLASLLLCAAVGLWALRRYLFLLAHAEAAAHQADCPRCGVYARFKLVHGEDSGAQVCCKECGQEWRIDD